MTFYVFYLNIIKNATSSLLKFLVFLVFFFSFKTLDALTIKVQFGENQNFN